MTIFNSLSFLLIILSIVPSCEKEAEIEMPHVVIDTIYPLPYYPAFPGSRWEYIENHTEMRAIEVSRSYEIYDFQGGSYLFFVPYIGTRPVFGYDHPTFVSAPFCNCNKLYPYIKTKLGAKFWRTWVDPRYSQGRKIDGEITVDSVLSNVYYKSFMYDSVIVLKERNYHSQDASQLTWEYYAKNVGLYRKVKIDTITNDTTYLLELIKWEIKN